MTSRHWCFTSYRPDLFIGENAKDYYQRYHDLKINYIVYQLERCPETSREHIQGYVEFKVPCRIPHAKVQLRDTTAHLEKRKGTRQQAVDYCKKEDTRIEGPYEYGNKNNRQGARNDLHHICEMVKTSLNVKDVADEYPELFVKYHKGLRELVNMYVVPRTWKTRVIILWGPPNTGKTRYCFRYDPDAYFLQRGNGNNLWFDGYNGQGTVIIDDFYNTIKYDTMLRLCDRYPCRVEIKGGTVEFVPNTIFITTNLHPSDIYKEIEERDAFWRRVSFIFHMESENICYLSDRYGNRSGENIPTNGILWNYNQITPIESDNE